MRVIVCGGRDYADRDTVRRELEALSEAYYDEDVTIVHGDARGADRLAAAEAGGLGFTVEAHPANWTPVTARWPAQSATSRCSPQAPTWSSPSLAARARHTWSASPVRPGVQVYEVPS